jgi:uncharacterized protein YjaZ
VSVIETNKWLEKKFDHPLEICQKILKEDTEKAKGFYRYLQKFGMYSPTKTCRNTYELLDEKDIWKTVNSIYKKYRKEWNGPDIPVYIFPLYERSQLFTRTTTSKSGLSFQDKLFLFLTHNLHEKEIEALLVHEYHHVCRMNASNKKIKEYTLLDSIVLEGLAEVAVKECCGSKYLAEWCTLYSNEEIKQYAKKLLVDNLSSKKDTRIHNQLLFGEGSYPKMLGYALGFAIASQYKESKKISLKDTFTISSDHFKPFI